MYASIDFATKRDFCRAVKNGEPVICYSPVLGFPAVSGTATVVGPWPKTPVHKDEPAVGPLEKRSRTGARNWTARVEVKDMRVVAVR